MGHPRDRKWHFQNSAVPPMEGPLMEVRLYHIILNRTPIVLIFKLPLDGVYLMEGLYSKKYSM